MSKYLLLQLLLILVPACAPTAQDTTPQLRVDNGAVQQRLQLTEFGENVALEGESEPAASAPAAPEPTAASVHKGGSETPQPKVLLPDFSAAEARDPRREKFLEREQRRMKAD